MSRRRKFDIMRRSFATAFLLGIFMLSPHVIADDGESLLPTESSEKSGTNAASIDVETDAATDEGIRTRLGGIYDELEALEKIDVSVINGIVTLTGTVSSSQAAGRAQEIASQVIGVVDVVDELAVDTDVGRRVETTVDRLQAMFGSIVANLPVFLLALLIIVAFWFAGRWIGSLRRLFRTIAPNTFIAELLSLLARVVVVLAGVILALTLLDATSIIGSVLGAAGIVGLAIGFAVRDTVENFIASILLSLRTPFIARDYVRIGEHEGTVARLTSRATILISLDGNHLRVPNALVYKAVIVNYTRQPERRFEFVVGVDTDLDLNAAQQTALDTIYDVPGVLAEPAATVLVTELGDSNVSLTVRAWIDQRTSDLIKVRSEAIRQVKQAFDDAGISMPEPVYRVRFNDHLVKIVPSVPAPEQVPPADTNANSVTTARTADTAAPGRDDSLTDTTGRDVSSSNGNGNKTGNNVAAQACDTTVDDSVNRSIDRELSDAESENLLDQGSRTE